MSKRQKTPFGEFLVQEIKRANMTQETFYTAVGITKPYFYDILTASPPPVEIQNKMVEVLNNQAGEDAFRGQKLFDLAAQERNELPADIYLHLIENSDNWDVIRKMLAVPRKY